MCELRAVQGAIMVRERIFLPESAAPQAEPEPHISVAVIVLGDVEVVISMQTSQFDHT